MGGVNPHMMGMGGGYGFGQGAMMGGMGMGGMGMGMQGGMPGFMGPWTQMPMQSSPLSNQIPGVGYMNNGQLSVYPQHHPSISAMHPHSPYNFGGYDAFGFPLPHPGVASSTPPPGGEGGEAAKKA